MYEVYSQKQYELYIINGHWWTLLVLFSYITSISEFWLSMKKCWNFINNDGSVVRKWYNYTCIISGHDSEH